MVMNGAVATILVALVGNTVYHQIPASGSALPGRILGVVTAIALGVFLCTLMLAHGGK